MSDWAGYRRTGAKPLADLHVDVEGFGFTDEHDDGALHLGGPQPVVLHPEWKFATMTSPFVAQQMTLGEARGFLVAGKKYGWEVDVDGSSRSANWAKPHFIWVERRDADDFVRAVASLMADAHAASGGPADAAFEAVAAKWRAAADKPPLSEEARTHKVLAEAAFQEKDLDRAIEQYDLALQIAPTWPEGNFNLALLLGDDAKDYRGAIRYMKRYLLLVPDAPDAQAAKDKVIIWQDRIDHPR